MVKYRLKRIFDRFIRAFVFGFLSILILLYSILPCFASALVGDIDLYDSVPVPGTSIVNYNKLHLTFQGQRLTRFHSPAGNVGVAFVYNLTDFLYVGNKYTLSYFIRPSNSNTSVTFILSNILSSEFSDYDDSTNSIFIANYNTSTLNAGNLNGIESSFSVSNILSKGRIYLICFLSTGTSSSTVDFTNLKFYDNDEFSGNWGNEPLTITDIDLGDQLDLMNDNGNTLSQWLVDFKSNTFILQSIRGVGSLWTTFLGNLSTYLTPLFLVILFAGCVAVVTSILRHIGTFSDGGKSKK